MKRKLIMFLAVILTIALVSCTTDKKIVLNEDATNENEKLVNDMGIEVKEDELEVRGRILTFMDNENLLTIESNENPEADGMYSQYIYNIKSKKSKKMDIEKVRELNGLGELGDGEHSLYSNSENGKLYLYNWKNDELELLFDSSTDSEIMEMLNDNKSGRSQYFDRIYGCNNLVSYNVSTFEATPNDEGKSNFGKSILVDTNTKKKYNLVFEEEGVTVDSKITYSIEDDTYYFAQGSGIYSFKIGADEDIKVKTLNTDNVSNNITGDMTYGFIDKSGTNISTYPGEGAPISFLDLETMEETVKPSFEHKNYFEINSFNYNQNYAVINANPFAGKLKEGEGTTPEVYLAKIINNEMILFNKIKEKEADGKDYGVVSMFSEDGSKVIIGNREIEDEDQALFSKEVEYKLYSIN